MVRAKKLGLGKKCAGGRRGFGRERIDGSAQPVTGRFACSGRTTTGGSGQRTPRTREDRRMRTAGQQWRWRLSRRRKGGERREGGEEVGTGE